MNKLCSPLTSLKEGRWFKLICGASYQHLPAIQNLALVYSIAGADCIDVAADPAVIRSARLGLDAAAPLRRLAIDAGLSTSSQPWLMVSLNDGEDPHFRKAVFDPTVCPPQCPRPCEAICPAQAIRMPPASEADPPDKTQSVTPNGVLTDRCYGCGRCVPICPLDHISTQSHQVDLAAIAPTLLSAVDAVEIHTQIGRETAFKTLWQTLSPWIDSLKLIAISCTDGPGIIEYLWTLHDSIQPLAIPLIWQTDGRSMSGDIGRGTTHSAIRFAQKVLQTGPPGYVQLAGGTNFYTVPKLSTLGLLRHHQLPPPDPQMTNTISGVAYGSYARKLVMPSLELAYSERFLAESVPFPSQPLPPHLTPGPASESLSSPSTPFAPSIPDWLASAVGQATLLVKQLKGDPFNLPPPTHVTSLSRS